MTPYFIFVRDTLSYLALLGLHLFICLAPSTIAFSGVEWAIFLFFLGRIAMEGRHFIRAHVLRRFKRHQDATGSERGLGVLWRMTKYFRYMLCSIQERFPLNQHFHLLGPVHTCPDISESATFSFRIQKFPRPYVIGFVADLLVSTVESRFKNIVIFLSMVNSASTIFAHGCTLLTCFFSCHVRLHEHFF